MAAPLLGVMVLTMGVIHARAVTPVEASGIGAARVIPFAFPGRKMGWAGFRDAVRCGTG